MTQKENGYQPPEVENKEEQGDTTKVSQEERIINIDDLKELAPVWSFNSPRLIAHNNLVASPYLAFATHNNLSTTRGIGLTADGHMFTTFDLTEGILPWIDILHCFITRLDKNFFAILMVKNDGEARLASVRISENESRFDLSFDQFSKLIGEMWLNGSSEVDMEKCLTPSDIKHMQRIEDNYRYMLQQ